jgi:delta 1-pyrroline-5-carboxylate dehydrogenase
LGARQNSRSFAPLKMTIHSRDDNCKRIRRALARRSVPRTLLRRWPPTSEFAVSRIASVNPATGEVLGELDSAGPTEVRAAVARARAAQPDWNAWGIRNRVRVLRRFQQILLARKTDIARRITQEAASPWLRRCSPKFWSCSMRRDS